MNYLNRNVELFHCPSLSAIINCLSELEQSGRIKLKAFLLYLTLTLHRINDDTQCRTVEIQIYTILQSKPHKYIPGTRVWFAFLSFITFTLLFLFFFTKICQRLSYFTGRFFFFSSSLALSSQGFKSLAQYST